MEFLPKALGTRPRLAVEVRTEGVVAARAEDAAGVLVAVSRANVSESALIPGLKAGNVIDRAEMTAAVRSTLDAVAGRGPAAAAGRGAGAGPGRSRHVTVIVPDAAVRVLLLDFDSLPGKIAEALPVVRFRLKKLLPFEVDDAVVSYQTMSVAKGLVTVVAVAIPREVLAEYEGLVISAGYLPGAVLPSTLSALAGLGVGSSSGEDAESATLLVNAGTQQVTTAIVRGGVLLLHRTLEMSVPAGSDVPESVDRDRIEAEAEMQAGALATAVELSSAGEITQAVSVAAAYFEDTLSFPPTVLVSAGTRPAEALERVLETNGLEGLRVREMMEPGMFAAGAASASVPRGWLAGVRGALTS